MSQDILPEGRLLSSSFNQKACVTLAALRRAMAREDILEGLALMSDPEQGLHVAVGSFSGYIPRSETALGLDEGMVREIAVLTRVGKPVCFTISEISEENGKVRLLLSRKRAQELAWAYLSQLPLGSIVPVTVTRLEPFGAFVDMGCGLASMIGVDRISVSRIRHPSDRFSLGQEIWAAILDRNLALRHLRLTHKELLGTWQENAEHFSVGMTVPGVVRGIADYGLFVELRPNLTGLAEPCGGIRNGDRVSVYIKSIFLQATKLKLLIINKLPPAPPQPLEYVLPENLHLTQWCYSPFKPQSYNETVFSLEDE